MLNRRKHILYIILALIIACPVFLTALPGCNENQGGGGGGGTAPTYPSIPTEPTPNPESGVKYAYASAGDGSVYVFDADNFAFVKKMSGLSMSQTMCFSKNAKRTDGGPKYLYVANRANVKRFNLSTQTLDADWISPGGISLANVQITPDDKYLYAVDIAGNRHNILVINVDTGSEVPSSPIVMPVNSILLDASMTPDGSKLVIGDSGFGPPGDWYHIPLMRTSDNTIYATILTLFGRPGSALVHPNNSYAYSAMSLENKIAIVNINTQSIVGSVNLGIYPGAMVISPDGNYGYVINYWNATISVLRLNGAEATEILPRIQLPAYTQMPGISSDGKYLWAPGEDHKIYVIDTTTKAIVKTLGEYPEAYFQHVLVE